MSGDQSDFFPDAPVDFRGRLIPGRTAMHRKAPSPIARALIDAIARVPLPQVRRILDYGCGVGRDVEFYRSASFDAVGYDPHPEFNCTELPNGQFDLVTSLFVLNVIKDPQERISVCQIVLEHCRVGGLLVIATRSPTTITDEATKKNWPAVGDGYLSSAGRRTFQKGISEEEILSYIGGENIEIIPDLIKKIPSACVVVARRV